MITKPKRGHFSVRRFMAQWVGVTAIGLMLGVVLSYMTYLVIPMPDAPFRHFSAYMVYLFEQPFRGVFHILPLALGQYWVLRRWFQPPKGWLAATVVGFVVYLAIMALGKFYGREGFTAYNYSPNLIGDPFYGTLRFGIYMPLLTDNSVPALCCGFVLGMLQLLCLRSIFRKAGWWVVISTLAFWGVVTLGTYVTSAILPNYSNARFNATVLAVFIAAQGAMGLLLGVLTGMGILFLRIMQAEDAFEDSEVATYTESAL